MNTFDIIIASVLVFGLVRGLFKGFFVEVASLVAIFLGIYGTIHFSFFVSDYLKDTVSWDDSVVQLVSFCITFMFILLAVSLLGKLLTKIIDFAELGLLNRIAGGIFGALKFGLILSAIFIFFDKMNNTIPFVKKEVLNQSILFEPVKKVAPMIFPSIIKDEEKLDK